MKVINLRILRVIAASLMIINLSWDSLTAAELVSQHSTVVNDTTVWGLPVKDISLKRNGDLMTVKIDMLLRDYKLKGDKVTVFTPILRNGSDSLSLTPIGLYSHIRYIQYLRDGGEGVSGENEISLKNSKRPQNYDLMQSVPFEEWMNGSTLYLRKNEFGCCHTLLESDSVPLAKWYETSFTPEILYLTDIKTETQKIRELSGRAYIDFPVNKTVIYPDYRRNAIELDKIIATIDSVKNDKDITVTSLSIKGFASPEGSYDNNIRLAKGRTEALKDYVQQLYKFPKGFITTSYEPEDWEGLREWVLNSNIDNKQGILSIIDSDLPPDPKNTKIQTTYPVQYSFLLATVYPALRHSDYRIEYMIRQFSDIDEIQEVIKNTPQKLSLNEMYLLANSLHPGSNEFNNVFETAVRMYPNEEVANLNAANAAMNRNDMETAAKYLAKSGQSDEAVYARGVYAFLNGNYTEALRIFGNISSSMPQASEAYEELKELLNIQ